MDEYNQPYAIYGGECEDKETCVESCQKHPNFSYPCGSYDKCPYCASGDNNGGERIKDEEEDRPEIIDDYDYGSGGSGGKGGSGSGSGSILKDCAGVTGGKAYKDLCGSCVGGDTGRQPCVIDCAGIAGGKAYKDECGTCVGGTTRKDPCICSGAKCSFCGGFTSPTLRASGDFCPICRCTKAKMDSTVTDRLKCVMGTLFESTTQGDMVDLSNVGDMVANICGTVNQMNNITFKVSDLKAQKYEGMCQKSKDQNGAYYYEIHIDASLLETASDLHIAATVIHELIHLNLFVQVEGTASGPASFAETWEQYLDRNNGETQHTIMAEKYVEKMSACLAEYHKKYGIETRITESLSSRGYTLEGMYNALAWEGLGGTALWEEKKLDSKWMENHSNNLKNAKFYYGGRKCE